MPSAANLALEPKRPATQRLAACGLGGAVMLLALILRLHGLGAKPLWNDEAWSILISGTSATSTMHAVQADYHPPLYYLTLYVWQMLGDGVSWVRLLSVAFGAASVGLVFATGCLLGGLAPALAAGLVLASAPLHVEWGQVARGYAELDFAIALGLLGTVRILARSRPDPVPVGGWVAYIGGATMALYIHNLAAFFILIANIAALTQWLIAWRCERRFAYHWIGAQLVVVALYVPWVPSLLGQLGRLGAAHHFFASSWSTFIGDVATVYGVSSLWTLAPAALAVFAILAGWGLTTARMAPGGRRILAIMCVAPIMIAALPFAAGKVFFGVLIGKLVWLGVPYSLAVGCGIATLLAETRWRRPVAAAPALLLCGVAAALQLQGLRNMYQSQNPAWDLAAALTHRDAEPGDVIMDDPDNPAHAYEFYCRHLGVVLPHVYPGKDEYPAKDETGLASWLAHYHRVWIPTPVPPQENLLPQALAAADGAGLFVKKSAFRSVTLSLVSTQPLADPKP